jgi:hypothetical protein
MPEQIKDGTGRGYLVKVTADNQILVDSRSVSSEHYANEMKQKAFNTNFQSTSMTAAKRVIHYFKNTGTKAIIFEGISWNVTQNIEIELRFNMTGTLAGGTDMDVGNLHSGSNNTLDMTAKYGDNITGLSGGTLIFRAKQAAGNYSVNTNFEADVILAANTDMAIYGTGASSYDMLGFYVCYEVEDN